MTVRDEKDALRKASFLTRRAAFDSADQSPATDLLLDHIRRIPALEVVSGYAPIRTEIDPMPAMGALAEEGMTLCLPVVAGKGLPLEFRRWSPGDPLVPGAFGAMIPERDDRVEPDLLISPLLAFDALGFRLGYGGGFYDRTLARLRGVRRTYAVGFAFAAQQVDAVPRDATDQPLDAVVTERGVHLTA